MTTVVVNTYTHSVVYVADNVMTQRFLHRSGC